VRPPGSEFGTLPDRRANLRRSRLTPSHAAGHAGWCGARRLRSLPSTIPLGIEILCVAFRLDDQIGGAEQHISEHHADQHGKRREPVERPSGEAAVAYGRSGDQPAEHEALTQRGGESIARAPAADDCYQCGFCFPDGAVAQCSQLATDAGDHEWRPRGTLHPIPAGPVQEYK
jgi:hypothetical protein